MNTCPRCAKPYAGYPALSRTDNATNICSACGTTEAMEEHMGSGLIPQSQWLGL